jgi:hypothetical protein
MLDSRTLQFFGVKATVTNGQAAGIIMALQRGDDLTATLDRLHVYQFELVGPSRKQLDLLRWKLGEEFVPLATTPRACSMLLDAKLQPLKLYKRLRRRIEAAKSAAELSAISRDVVLIRKVLPKVYISPLVDLGHERRKELGYGRID